MSECMATQTTKRDLRLMKYRAVKSKVGMFCYAVFWRILWLTRLATPYSKTMCKLNLYRKYPDGRCQYCGEVK